MVVTKGDWAIKTSLTLHAQSCLAAEQIARDERDSYNCASSLMICLGKLPISRQVASSARYAWSSAIRSCRTFRF